MNLSKNTNSLNYSSPFLGNKYTKSLLLLNKAAGIHPSVKRNNPRTYMNSNPIANSQNMYVRTRSMILLAYTQTYVDTYV